MSSLGFDSWMLLVTAAGTAGLVFVAYLAYQKFLSQEALKTQMEIVIQLVQDLSASKVPIELRRPASTKTESIRWNYSLFEVAFGNDKDVFQEKLNLEVLLMKKELHEVLSRAFAHLGNPLLPDSIAQKLWTIKSLDARTPNAKDLNEKSYYIIGSFSALEENMSNVVLIPNKMNGFKTACVELKTSITNWFEEHKVKDTNSVAFMNIDG